MPEAVLTAEAPSPRRPEVTEVALRIRPDPFCESDGRAHFQWFYFKAAGLQRFPRGHTVRFVIENAGDASFAPAWNGYTTVYSTDRSSWRRVARTVGANPSRPPPPLLLRHVYHEAGISPARSTGRFISAGLQGRQAVVRAFGRRRQRPGLGLSREIRVGFCWAHPASTPRVRGGFVHDARMSASCLHDARMSASRFHDARMSASRFLSDCRHTLATGRLTRTRGTWI